MVSSFDNSISGTLAAADRVAAAASNIANQRTRSVGPASEPKTAGDEKAPPAFEGYRPVRIDQESVAGGGVRTVAREVDPASVPVFDPAHPDADADGVVHMPNVSLETEMVDLLQARQAFEANLKAVETAKRMLGAVFDVVS